MSWSVEVKVFATFVQLVVIGRDPPLIARLILPSFAEGQYGSVVLIVSTVKESGCKITTLLSKEQLFWSATVTVNVPAVKLLAVSVC